MIKQKWNIEYTEDFKVKITPNFDVMAPFIASAARQLQETVMEYEEKLVLTAVSEEGLKRLIQLCENELKSRVSHER